MLLDEAREARIAGGLTLEEVGRAIGTSKSRASATERGEYPDVPFVRVAQLLAVVGLELSARAYPVECELRDRGQGRLLDRLRGMLATGVALRTEVPISGPGDLRAWDAVLDVHGSTRRRIGVDAETRLRDFQAVDRRVKLKARDSGVDRVIILVADTRHNRDVLRALDAAIRVDYPIRSGAALAALAEGRDPGGNGVAKRHDPVRWVVRPNDAAKAARSWLAEPPIRSFSTASQDARPSGAVGGPLLRL